MNLISKTLCLLALCLLFSCSDDDMALQETLDTEGPELYDVRWIDNPSIENEPTGSISDGENYTISITSGFQVIIRIRDQSIIEGGEAYFLVNDDENIRENIIYDETILNYEEGTLGFSHRVDRISLGDGLFYDLQVGDRYHFYLTFRDIHGNETMMSWTADLVD